MKSHIVSSDYLEQPNILKDIENIAQLFYANYAN